MTFAGLCRCGVVALALATFGFVAGDAWAGDAEDYTVYFRDSGDFDSAEKEVSPDSTFDIDLFIDADGSVDINGFQWGVCMDDTVLDIEDGDIDFSDDFTASDFTFEARGFEDGGWTVGALTNVVTGFTIEAVDEIHLYVCTYTVLDDAGAFVETEIEFCDTLGSPIVVTNIVTVNSTEPVPTKESFTVIESVIPEYVGLAMADVLPEDPTAHVLEINAGGTTADAAEVPIYLWNDNETGGAVGAYSFGVTHGGDKLELTDINTDGTDAEDADFLAVDTEPTGGVGGTIAVVLSLGSLETEDPVTFDVRFGEPYHIANFVYGAGDDAAVGDEVDLDFSGDLGDPPVAIALSVEGATLDNDTLDFLPGSVVIELGKGGGDPTSLMLRADIDDNQVFDLADITALLEFTFQNGDDPPCRRAADFDDDGDVEITDVIALFNWIFLNGEDPAGGDPTCTETLQEEEDKETCLDDQSC